MLSVQSECPPRMYDVTYEMLISLSPTKLDDLWHRLSLRETFTRGQLFPYQVEFIAPSSTGKFEDGELNIHHGPLLSAHGAINGISASHRGICYYFGSYVISFRLIRLVRLDFYREAEGVKVSFRAFVSPWFRPIWRLSNRLFWSLFRFSMFL